MPRFTSKSTILVAARVGDSSRRTPEPQATYPARASASGCTFRSEQHRSGSRSCSFGPCSASCSATVCGAVTLTSVIGRTLVIQSRVPSVSAKWYPVSRKITWTPGSASEARWDSRPSDIDDVMAKASP